MALDLTKTIEEEVVSIHQTMKEQIKPHIPQHSMDNDAIQGKMKG